MKERLRGQFEASQRQLTDERKAKGVTRASPCSGNGGEIDGGASMSPPELRLRTFGLYINESRDAVKDKAYWKQRELSKKAAEMSPHDRQEFWDKQLVEDEVVNG